MALKIIVPFDISDYSRAAASEAIAYGESLGGYIIFIHIVEPEPAHRHMYSSYPADARVEDEIFAIVKKWYESVAQECVAKHVGSEMHILYHRASVSQTIVDYAKETEAHLIVIGHHITHGFNRLFEENVTKNIIDHTPCSVLVTSRERV